MSHDGDSTETPGRASDQELTQKAREKAKFNWKIIPLGLITAVIIAVLIDRLAGAEEFADSLKSARWEWLAIPILLSAANQFLGALRWRIILNSMGVYITQLRALTIVFATWPFALITPSRASDLLRAVMIRDQISMVSGSSSVVAEKLVDVQSLCLLGIFGALWMGRWQIAAIIAFILISEWTAAILILSFRNKLIKLPLVNRFEKKVEKLFDAFVALRAKPLHFLVVSLTSIASWLTALAMLYSLFRMFGTDVSALHVAALWPIAIFVGMLPLTVAGIGTRDATFVYLLSLVTTGPIDEAGVLAGTFFYALAATVLPALVGIPIMLRHMNEFTRAGDPTRSESD